MTARPLELVAVMDAAAPTQAATRRVVASGLAVVLAPSADVGRLRRMLAPAGARRRLGAALVARQKLLETLMPGGAVLPAAPGQPLAETEAAQMLRGCAGVLRAGLKAVAGRVQHQVRIAWDPAAALQRWAATPEIAAARRAEGDAFGPALRDGAEALRARVAAGYARRIAAACDDVVALPTEGPEDLLNLACLTAAGAPALEAALQAIDAEWTEGLTIRMIGPTPPISFHAVALERPADAALAEAARTLGLPWPCPPADVAPAYRALARAAHPDARPQARAVADDVGEAGDAMARLRAAADLLGRAAAARALCGALPPLAVLRREGDAQAAAPAAASAPAPAPAPGSATGAAPSAA